MKTKLLSIMIILSCLFSSFPVHAENTSTNNTENNSYTWYFSLDSQNQKATFHGQDGNEITLYVSSGVSGEKLIKASSIRLTAQFCIYTTNDIIVSAYNKSYNSNYYTVLSDFLSVTSQSEARYTLTCKKNLITCTKYLKVQIQNSSLIVTSNIQ